MLCSIACATRNHVFPKYGSYMAARYSWAFWIALKWQFWISSSVLKTLFFNMQEKIPRNTFLKNPQLVGALQWEHIYWFFPSPLACERALTIILNVGKTYIIELLCVCVCNITGDPIQPELRLDMPGLQGRRNLQSRSNSCSVCMPIPKV